MSSHRRLNRLSCNLHRSLLELSKIFTKNFSPFSVIVQEYFVKTKRNIIVEYFFHNSTVSTLYIHIKKIVSFCCMTSHRNDYHRWGSMYTTHYNFTYYAIHHGGFNVETHPGKLIGIYEVKLQRACTSHHTPHYCMIDQ